MNPNPLYKVLARSIEARDNCIKNGNTEWLANHTQHLIKLVEDYMPSGCGFDNGTTLDLDTSTPDLLVFYTSVHHMDPSGFYDGWTEHTVKVRPSLGFGFRLTISGLNRNDIKTHIHEAFDAALREEVRNA